MHDARRAHRSVAWDALVPVTFVLIWSTGFVVAKEGLPYADTMTFVALRFGIACGVTAAIAVAVRAVWPGWRTAGHVAVVGVLMHTGYVGGVFASIDHGLPAGVSALIVGLQPILSACIVGPILGESVSRQQWTGLVLGLAGVALVLEGKLTLTGASIGAALFSVIALLGITVATVYQKRFCVDVDVMSGAAIQYAAAAAVAVLFAVGLEPMRIEWTLRFSLSLAWFAGAISVGAISLLMLLIRRGAVAKTASLFYLVPPLTAVWAWLWFGETFHGTALGGLLVAAAGVALVQRGARRPRISLHDD